MLSSDRSEPRERRARRGKAVVAGLSALACVSTAMVVGHGGSATAAPGDETVQILSFNDYHGHVQSDTPGSIDGSFGGPAAGGGEYLSAKLAELRAASDADNSYTVAAGDLIGGSPFFSGLFHDEPSVESLNEMGLDFSGVGNHEFDEGVTELMRMQTGGCHPVDGCYFTDYDPDTVGDQEFPGANFQWLAANVTEDAPDGTDDFADTIAPYEIVTTTGGKKIAFIGMTLEGTSELVAAAGTVGFTFEDEVDSAALAADAIQAEDSDVEAMILLLHEGGIPSPFAINGCAGISGPIVTIAENLDSRIDAIVSGHTHQPYTCSIDDPADNPRPVTSAFSFGRVVTEINLELDATTGDVDRSTFTMVNHEVLQSELTPDPDVTAVIDKWTPLAEAQGNEQVGAITETITRGGGFGVDDRGVESAAGNLVADAQLAATEALGAQIAFMNPGGLRSDLEFDESDAGEGDGVVTYGEAFTFQPFNNTLFTLPMTGEQIVSVLEEQCQPGDASRPVLHLGVSDGFAYDLDITQQNGVCLDVEVSNVELDGVPIEPATEYLVTVNIFLADGGDNFDTFAEVDPTDRIPGPQDIDALVDYFESESPIAPPSTDRVNELGNTLPGTVQSLSPARLLETRVGPDNTTVDGEFEGEGRVAAGETVELVVAGRGNVPDDADAVALNVGAILPNEPGFLTIWPCGEDMPNASNVNYFGADVVSTSAFSQVGEDGKVCIYSLSETDMIVDVNGLVPQDGTPVPVVPARLLETRDGEDDMTVDGEFEGEGRLAAGETLELTVADRGGVDADAEAVILNVGAVLPGGDGFLTIWPCGEDMPNASNLNYLSTDLAISNSVLAKIGDEGKVCIYTLAETDLIADVNAFVPVGGSPDSLVPARLLETRDVEGFDTIDGEFQGEGRVEADSTIELDVAGRGGVDEDASTVVVNVGAVYPDAPGFLTVYPCDEERPNASNVNHPALDVVSNLVLAKLDDDGRLCIYSLVGTDLIVDVLSTTSPVVPYR